MSVLGSMSGWWHLRRGSGEAVACGDRSAGTVVVGGLLRDTPFIWGCPST